MREAARLMAKVFAVVFGAGAAVVVLLFLLVGVDYLYERVQHRDWQTGSGGTASAKQGAVTPEIPDNEVTEWDENGKPVGWKVQLDCPPKGSSCSVSVGGKAVGSISRQEVKDNLAGYIIYDPDEFGPPVPLDQSKAKP